MKIGVILPTFAGSAAKALEVAHRADRLGVHGVFAYDHLWPMGQPGRPALAPFPVLAAVAAATEQVCVGTLVARVGLVPDRVLVGEVGALSAVAPGRVVVALGTGDRLSAQENRAYGVPFAPAAERRASLRAVGRTLRDRGVPVWVGGGALPTVAVAEDEGLAVNLWAVVPELVAEQAARTEVTWAGPSPSGPAALTAVVAELAAAGATWAVFGWPVDLEALVAAAAGPAGGPAAGR